MKNHNRRRLQAVLGLVVLAALGLAQLLSVYASGVLYVAPAGNDANNCPAMSSACRTISATVSKASSGDTIIIAAGTYTENIVIDKDLTLIGFGADATIIDRGLVHISRATVHIFDLAMTRGNSGSDGDGGALYNDSGVVTLGYTSILSNHADYGGGIYNYSGTLVLDHSLVANNRTSHYGGVIYTTLGSVSISHSTIVSNSACNTACLYGMGPNATGQKPDYGFLSIGGGIENSRTRCSPPVKVSSACCASAGCEHPSPWCPPA